MGLIITLKKGEIARLIKEEEEISFKIRLGSHTVDLNIFAPKNFIITRDNYNKSRRENEHIYDKK